MKMPKLHTDEWLVLVILLSLAAWTAYVIFDAMQGAK